MNQIDHIMRIMRAAFDPRYGEAWTRRQISDSLLLPGVSATFDTASDGASPSGFVLCRRVLDEVEILLIAVEPAARGRGIASAMLGRLIDHYAADGVRRIFLEMRCDNSAIHLYRKFGFEQIGQRRGYYRGAAGGPLDAVTFAKTIG